MVSWPLKKLYPFLRIHVKIMHIALCDAFLELLPLVVIMASITLCVTGIDVIFDNNNWLLVNSFKQVHSLLTQLFPWFICMSVASHFAVSHSVRAPQAIIAATVTFIIVQLSSSQGLSAETNVWSAQYGINVILSPLTVIIFLRLILTPLGLDERTVSIDSYTLSTIKAIVPIILAVGFASCVLVFINTISQPFVAWLNSSLAQAPDIIKGVIRTLSIHLLWLTGLHGPNYYDFVFGSPFLTNTYISGISHEQFFNLFVILGGSGSCLSLLIALFFLQRDPQTKHLTRIALPMVIFNINEVLIFGLPIIFNRILWLPFILVPLINFCLGTMALNYGSFMLNAENVHWATPALLNMYWASGGNWILVLLQMALIGIGVAVYWPFVDRLMHINSAPQTMARIHGNFDIVEQLLYRERLGFWKKRGEYWDYRYQVFDAIRTIENNQLMLMYQPIVCVASGRCLGFEALLRIKTKAGIILPPTFMDTFEESGLAPTIDWWVAQTVKNTLKEQTGAVPYVSINVNPQTLAYSSATRHLAATFKGLSVRFEVIERALFDIKECQENVALLRDSGIKISIDDFGVGYANLSQLANGVADVVKIDRTLVTQLDTQQGQTLFDQVCTMCKTLELKIIAEGVESQTQYDYVVQAGVDMVQGFYFSKALSWDDAMTYYHAREPVADPAK